MTFTYTVVIRLQSLNEAVGLMLHIHNGLFMLSDEHKQIIVAYSSAYDEVYSPHRQYRQYRQTNRLTDRYKYNYIKTDAMKTKLKEKIKNYN